MTEKIRNVNINILKIIKGRTREIIESRTNKQNETMSSTPESAIDKSQDDIVELAKCIKLLSISLIDLYREIRVTSEAAIPKEKTEMDKFAALAKKKLPSSAKTE